MANRSFTIAELISFWATLCWLGCDRNNKAVLRDDGRSQLEKHWVNRFYITALNTATTTLAFTSVCLCWRERGRSLLVFIAENVSQSFFLHCWEAENVSGWVEVSYREGVGACTWSHWFICIDQQPHRLHSWLPLWVFLLLKNCHTATGAAPTPDSGPVRPGPAAAISV